MKKILLFLIVLPAWCFAPQAQAQKIAVKSNLLYDATTTINLGMEFRIAPKWTLDVPFNLNPWKFNDGARFKHWGVQPEARYWFCEPFRRSFIGIHAHYADFNMGGWPAWSVFSENMRHNRYQGHLYGAGVSYGYAWIIKERWGIEATVGAGYARIVYDKYPCHECGSVIKGGNKNYFGPTRVGLTLIYLIK